MSNNAAVVAAGGAPDDWASAVNLGRVLRYLGDLDAGAPIDPRCQLAWEHFYREAKRRIEIVLRDHGLAEPDLSDCNQDVWGKVLVNLTRFRFDPSWARFDTWLERVAANAARDAIRRRKRQRVQSFGALGLDSDHELAAIPGDPPPDGDAPTYAELLAAVERLRAELSPQNQYIMRARLIEGRGVAEIARRTGLAPSVVSTRLTRFRQDLREEIRRVRLI